MKRCLLLVFSLLLMFSFGCQEGPKGDPEFKKEKAEKLPDIEVEGDSGRATRSKDDL